MDIRLIPEIMRNRGWRNGARLQDIWFSRPANNQAGRGVPETNTIRMDSWALTFARCRQAYERITSERWWCSDEARDNLGRLLHGQGKLTSRETAFGDLSLQVPQLNDQVVTELWVGSLTDRMDDMYAALGNFALRVVVAGTVGPAGVQPISVSTMTGSGRSPRTVGRYTARIEQVGFFIRDSFDYEGAQALGFWSSNDVSRIPLPGYDWVGNDTYRDWRARNGRGGDFIVYSDLKIVRRSPPDTVEIPVQWCP
jgi:hypothetical protein